MIKYSIALLFLPLIAFGQFIPAGRTNDWRSPGVVGGIRSYPNFTNVVTAGADNTGSVDAYSVITNCIARATNGSAVYFPDGRYKIGLEILIRNPKQIVLRGQSKTGTVLEFTCTNSTYGGAISFASDTSRNSSSISSGYTSNSQSVIVSSASGMATGQLARLLQDNDPAVVFGSLSDTGVKWQGQLVTITNVSGTTITFDRPLDYTYGAGFNPVLEAFTSATELCGLENLTVSMKNNYTIPASPVYFYITQNCWMTNVAVTNGEHANIAIDQSKAFSVITCETRNHQQYDSNARYGIQLSYLCRDGLVQDNIVQGNNSAIIVQGGSGNNVIAYNFSSHGYGLGYPTDTGSKGGISCHGDNANNNIFEGNVFPWYSTDEFWGANRLSTVFRNWITRLGYVNETNLPIAQGATAVYVDSTNYYHNVIGNVLGSPRDNGDSNTNHIVWSIGYARRAGNDFPASPWDVTLVNARLWSHGNHDYVGNTIIWSNSYSTTLPASMYLSSKPAWFGSLAWPAVGPDVRTNSSITNAGYYPIPAMSRWFGDYSYTNVGSRNYSGTFTVRP